MIAYDGYFCVDSDGRSGGLAFLWNFSFKVTLLCFAKNFIDVKVEVPNLGTLRITGFYGFPAASHRCELWNLTRYLSSSPDKQT